MALMLRRITPISFILKYYNVNKLKNTRTVTFDVNRLCLKVNDSIKSSVKYNSNEFHSSCRLKAIVAFKLSDIGEGIREVAVKEWFVKEGDKIQQFDNVCEVQSDKASATITSRYDGVVKKLHYKIDDTALVGEALIDIEVEADDTEDDDTVNNSKIDQTLNRDADKSTGKVLTTPAVRRIAAQYKLDLNNVKASGRNGRVLKEDVLTYLNISSDESNVANSNNKPNQSLDAYLETDRTVPIGGFQKVMVKTMTASLKIPHFVLSDEYNVTELVLLRKKLNETAAKEGVKLTYMPIIIKAVSLGLKEFPIFNSIVDEGCENITYKSPHNIAIAIDTPKGLVVPNIKNVERKNLIEIAKELNRLQEAGLKGTLGVSDLSGGTFTVSNIGNIGGTYTKPVILPPQVCIGAFGRIKPTVQFDISGNVVRAEIIVASWSADHRVIDGATMTRFSNIVKNFLENPEKLILYA